jgi:sugar phosphate isomerase/epimerase
MMKLAVAVASDAAPPEAFVVWRGFESSLPKAAAMGYHGVELALKTAEEIDLPRLRQMLSRDGLEVSCISTGQVFACLGLYFTTTDAQQRSEVLRVFRGLIDLAAELRTMVNIGRARGFIAPGESPDDATTRFVDVARELADYAAPKNVTLILEPVNRYEINFIHSVKQGDELMRKVDRPNMALMPDLFHMNIEDATLVGELEKYADRVAYLHLADSNRLAPGWGHTDFDAVFASLARMKYSGWTSVEILPKPDPDSAARQAAEFLLPRIQHHNTRLGLQE